MMPIWRYIFYTCWECGERWEEMLDKDAIPEELPCVACDSKATRTPYATIAKDEIAEKTHGGIVHEGKLYRKHTGHKENVEQNKLEQQLRKFRRIPKALRGLNEEYRTVKGELDAKRKETKEKLKENRRNK